MQEHNNSTATAVQRTSPVVETCADEVVVARVKSGDLNAFELLMRRYNQRLFRVACGIVGDKDEAEDVVQETYVRAYERLSQFEGRARFSTWLTRITVNEAITRRNKLRRLKRLEGDDAVDATAVIQAPAMHNDPLENASLSEIGKLVASEVERLPSALRAVFVMRAVEQLDTKETADCLNLTEANVKVRFHRARTLLRSRIDKQIEDDVRQLYQFEGARCDRIVSTVLARVRRIPPPRG